jgi:hypothetical protein
MRKIWMGMLTLSVVGVGCNKSETPPAPAAPAPAAPAPAAPGAAPPAAAPGAPAAGGEATGDYTVTEVTGGGSVTGTVKWTGPAPKLEDLKVTKDPATCGKAKKYPRHAVGSRVVVAKTYVDVAVM